MANELDLGELDITILTDGQGGPVAAKFTLPDGSVVVRALPENGELTMRLGLGLGFNVMPITASGVSAPAVPENAKVHIDFPNNRAWVEGTGVVAVDTLLGSDPNTENLAGPSDFLTENLTVDGYEFVETSPFVVPVLGYLGVLKNLVLSGATVRIEWKSNGTLGEFLQVLTIGLADGSNAIDWYVTSGTASGASWSGSYNEELTNAVETDEGSLNCMAITTTPTRGEFSVNGSAAVAAVLDETDYPASGYEVALTGFRAGCFLRFITIYDPLPDTTGLAALSALPETAPAQFGTGDWSVADAETGGDITITITALPDDGGSAITDLEYQIDGGSWVSLAGTTTGDYPVSGLTDDVEVDVAIRAVNAVGAGTASATKPVTPTAPVAWAPSDLGATLIGWYKGDELSGSNGATIATWPDDSGNGNDATQATEADKPTLAAAVQNGLNVVRFTAASTQWFNLPNLFSGAAAGSMFLVIKRTQDPASAQATAGSWDFGTHNTFRNAFIYTDGNIYDDFGSTSRQSVGDPAESMTSWRIANFHSAASDFGFLLDGKAKFSTSSNTVAWTSVPSIGRSPSGAQGTLYLDAWIAEVVLVNSKLSTENRQKVEGYLAHKWGLTANLDAGHPYKSSPP